MRKFTLLPIALIFCLFAVCLAPSAAALDDPEISARAALLADPETGRVYYSLNADERAYPASLTKVMTVLLAVEAVERGEVSQDDQVTASESAMEGMVEDGSTAGIVPGETMSFGDLLYCAMLSSANEACNIIAEHVSGSVGAFVELMNERASELGCAGTHFANTHGLPDENHYTTAADLALIAAEALQHDLFTTICNTVTWTVPATNVSEQRTLSNSNALINPNSGYGSGYYYEYAHGVKTGHTNDAGYCLISTAEKDGIRLMAIVLGCPAMELADGSGVDLRSFSDSIVLYDWVFDNFSMQEIVSSAEQVAEAPVELGQGVERVSLRPANVVTAVVADDTDLSTVQRDVVVYSERDGETLVAPISAGTVLGELTLTLDGQVLGRSELVASTSVELSRAEYMKGRLAETFASPWVIGGLVFIVIFAAGYIFLVVRYRSLHKRHLRSVRQAEAERRAHNVYSEPRQQAAHAPEQRRPAAPPAEKKPAAAPKPSAPMRAAAKDSKSSPDLGFFSVQDVQSRETVKIASNLPSEGNKNRRDYFEEFFRTQHEEEKASAGKDGSGGSKE